jgi:hypothetical protein
MAISQILVSTVFFSIGVFAGVWFFTPEPEFQTPESEKPESQKPEPETPESHTNGLAYTPLTPPRLSIKVPSAPYAPRKLLRQNAISAYSPVQATQISLTQMLEDLPTPMYNLVQSQTPTYTPVDE